MIAMIVLDDVLSSIALFSFLPCAVLSLIIGLTETSLPYANTVLGWTFASNGITNALLVLAIWCHSSKCIQYSTGFAVIITGISGTTLLLNNTADKSDAAYSTFLIIIGLQSLGILCFSYAYWQLDVDNDTTQEAVIVEIPTASPANAAENVRSTPVAEPAALARSYYEP